MTTFHLQSDLHLEFLNDDIFAERIENDFYKNKTNADVLILAGDITPDLRQYRKFLDYVSKEYKEVVAVAGNHEFYGRHIGQQTNDLFFLFDKLHNTHFLDCELKEVLGVRIFGGTCWTDLANNELEICRSMSDFAVISELTIAKWREMHNEFRKALSYVKNVDLVVSHHLPDMRFIGGEYKSSNYSAGYASTDMINLLGRPKVWVHGHAHTPSDITTNTTRFLCNPTGYYAYEISQYNDQLTFEI